MPGWTGRTPGGLSLQNSAVFFCSPPPPPLLKMKRWIRAPHRQLALRKASIARSVGGRGLCMWQGVTGSVCVHDEDDPSKSCFCYNTAQRDSNSSLLLLWLT